MELSDAAIKDMVVVALAEDMGLLDERDRQRDLEKAKKMLFLDIPAEKVAKAMELPLDMVEALA